MSSAGIHRLMDFDRFRAIFQVITPEEREASYESLCQDLKRFCQDIPPKKFLPAARGVWRCRPKGDDGLSVTQLIFEVLAKAKEQDQRDQATRLRFWATEALQKVGKLKAVQLGGAPLNAGAWTQKLKAAWDLHPRGNQGLNKRRSLGTPSWQIIVLGLRRTFPPLKTVSLEAAVQFYALQQICLGGNLHGMKGELTRDEDIPRALATLLLAARKGDATKRWTRFHGQLVNHVDSGRCSLTEQQWQYMQQRLGKTFELGKASLAAILERQKPSMIPSRVRNSAWYLTHSKNHGSIVPLTNIPDKLSNRHVLVNTSPKDVGRLRANSGPARLDEAKGYFGSRGRPPTVPLAEIIKGLGKAQRNNSIDRYIVDVLNRLGIAKLDVVSEELGEKQAATLALLHVMMHGEDSLIAFDCCRRVAQRQVSEFNSEEKRLKVLLDAVVKDSVFLERSLEKFIPVTYKNILNNFSRYIKKQFH